MTKNSYTNFLHFIQNYGNLNDVKVYSGEPGKPFNYDEIIEAGFYEIVDSSNGSKETAFLIVNETLGEIVRQTRISGFGGVEFREKMPYVDWSNWNRVGEEYIYAIEELKKTLAPIEKGDGVDSIKQTASSGVKPTAKGIGASALGVATNADGNYAHAQGWYTNAKGRATHAEGYRTTAENDFSHGEGSYSTASGASAHAEGENTQATGKRSHSEGYKTKALGESSHAQGESSEASGKFSHAEGQGTKATKIASHAEGANCQANADYAHAEGANNIAYGNASHVEGVNTYAHGVGSHAEGGDTKAYGANSHAEGYGSAVAVISEVNGNPVINDAASKTTEMKGAHAEGWQTVASANGAHSEGNQTHAFGVGSHAEGGFTEAREKYSHAGGVGTIASAIGQYVCGKYNIPSETALFVIGCGKDENNRKNAFMVDVDSNGNIFYDFFGSVFTPESMANLKELSKVTMAEGVEF